jgi:hypothetical protein
MQYEFRYEITDDLARAASRRFVRHYVGWRVPVLFGVAALILVLICASDEEGYVCGFFAGAFVLLGVFITRRQYFALPADKLAGEAGAFVERCVAAAGGKLR